MASGKLAITQNLGDANFWVRYQAASAICESEEVAFSHAEQLASLLQRDESRLVRHECAKAMCLLGLRAMPYVQSLVVALNDSEMLVRRDAAKALYGIGNAATPHVSALAEKLADSFWPVRWWAARSLSALPAAASPHAWQLVVAAVYDAEMPVRETSARALGAMGRDAAHHMETLANLVLEGNPQEVQRAGDALAYALSDPDLKVRGAVCEGLYPFCDRCISNVMEGLARRPTGDSKGQAVDRTQVEKLRYSLVDEDWIVRRKAVDTMRMYGKITAADR